MNKEEILLKHLRVYGDDPELKIPIEVLNQNNASKTALQAMEEYGKNIATEFLKWTHLHNWQNWEAYETWYQVTTGKKLTRSKLFDLFMDLRNKNEDDQNAD